MTIRSILWRGLFLQGHEACGLFSRDSAWHLVGTAAFVHDRRPCRLEYRIIADSGWNTVSARIGGWLGDKLVDIDLAVTPGHRWLRNGIEQPEVAGCIDLDLNFSPSTNLLPIRRLDLAIGQSAEVRAAWLRFPGFELEALPQVYRRLGADTYRYESGGGRFVADLKVDDLGFVTDYPGLWQAEAAT